MDRRQKKTIYEIEKTTLDLLKKKSLQELTIMEICEKANVGRSTFYLHFSDINDLINKIEDEKLISILKICADLANAQIQDICLEVARYVKKSPSVFKTLLLKTNHHFEVKLKNKFAEVVSQIYTFSDLSSFSRYYFSFIFNGALGVFKDWILDDCVADENKIVEGFLLYLKSDISKFRI